MTSHQLFVNEDDHGASPGTGTGDGVVSTVAGWCRRLGMLVFGLLDWCRSMCIAFMQRVYRGVLIVFVVGLIITLYALICEGFLHPIFMAFKATQYENELDCLDQTHTNDYQLHALTRDMVTYTVCHGQTIVTGECRITECRLDAQCWDLRVSNVSLPIEVVTDCSHYATIMSTLEYAFASFTVLLFFTLIGGICALAGHPDFLVLFAAMVGIDTFISLIFLLLGMAYTIQLVQDDEALHHHGAVYGVGARALIAAASLFGGTLVVAVVVACVLW